MKSYAQDVFDRERNVIHSSFNDITPANHAKPRLGIVLHFLEAGGRDGNWNHYEVAEMENKRAHWLAGHIEKEKELRQSTIVGFLRPPPPHPTQTNATCSRCGRVGVDGVEVFTCPGKGCTESICYVDLGLTKSVQCAGAYTCGEHRKGPPTLMFMGKGCIQCHQTKDLVVCPGCGMSLCKHHAMIPEDSFI